MADELVSTDAPVPPRRLRRDWARRLVNELLALFIALLVLLAAGLVLLDTAPGHRFIVDRIGELETASGLRFHIGRIDGSIFGKSQLRNVAVSDQRGVFLTSPEIELDWSPGAWLYNSLKIDSLTAERINLLRLPKLKPSLKKGPILPKFDIHIGVLRVDRLDIAPQVGGRARSGRLSGNADIRSGRALIDLNALISSGDRVAFHLDSEPDGD
ncbi:MAG: translocation/assembly module TamB, partial [Sphingomicrobium sp.]